MALYYVQLELRDDILSAEVGAETFDEAIELFKCWLIVNRPGFEEIQVLVVNGSEIGTHSEEEVVEVYKSLKERKS
jgi:hypothetical protein